MKQIIALAGKAGSGKDTVASILVHPFSLDSIAAFAAPIKAMIDAGFGIDMDILTREEKERPDPVIGISPRQLAQTLGTEWGRALDPDLWVKAFARRTESMHSRLIVITDCRFPNEVAWVKSQGGVVWWIERDGIAPVRAHASENSIGPQDCDRTILNLGTLDDLAITVQEAYAQLEAQREAA